MSLELMNEVVRINQAIGEDTTQTVIENDIIVPDVKPDIARILLLDGDIYVSDAAAEQDRILMNGIIRYKILYVSDDPEQPVKSINSDAQFSYILDVPNTRLGMGCRVRCSVEHMEYELLNSRKVNVKAVISVNGKVINQVEQNIAHDLEGVDNIQVLRNSSIVNTHIGSSDAGCPVREMVEIPAGKPTIKEILRNDVKITGKDYKLADGKVVVKGELGISTLYVGDDENRSIQFMEHEIPFTQFIEMSGLDEDSICEVQYDITNYNFTPEEDSDGELRQLQCEIDLNIHAECFGKREIELIEDAYSPKSRMDLEKIPFNMDEFVAENRSQAIIKATVEIDEESPDIAEVFNVLCNPVLSEHKISEDRMDIEGVLDCSILYLANNDEQPVFCFNNEIPFRHGIDIKEIQDDMNCSLDLNMEHCSYSLISAKEVELRFVVSVVARVTNQVTLQVIDKVTEVPLDEARSAGIPSITIYFTQQGDTLWKIAKKYYTTIDEIKKANNIDDDDINVGGQILIPRKYTYTNSQN